MTGLSGAKMLSAGDRLRSELGRVLSSCTDGFVAIGFFSFVINLCILVSPIYMMEVYNRVLPSQSTSTLYALTGLACSLIAATAVLEFVRSRILIQISARMGRTLNDRVLQASFYGTLTSSDVGGAQYLRDLDTVRQFIGGSGTLVFFDMPWTPILIAVIYALNPLLGFLTLTGAVLLLLLAAANEMATRAPLNESNRNSRGFLGFISSSLRNSEALYAMGMFNNLRRHRATQRDAILHHQTVASNRAGLLMAMSKALRQILQILLLGTGAYLALHNEISTGEIIAISIIAGRALGPIEMAIGTWKQFVTVRDSYSRLKNFLSASPEAKHQTSLPQPRGALDLEDLCATAPGGTDLILRNLTFSVEPGTILGIVGGSGAGKSSLARMLVGAWRPKSGKVRLDGADINVWNRDELGPCIGYLPQDIELFEGTVSENIARFSTGDDKLVVAAAQRAGAHAMIMRLPGGYDTPIGPGGTTLSGGQRQRIALARAMYGKPSLIVLDEPNANLDQDGEQALFGAIATMRKEGATVVLISHRAAVLDLADRLAVLNEGRLLALGPRQIVLNRLLEVANPHPSQPLRAVGAA